MKDPIALKATEPHAPPSLEAEALELLKKALSRRTMFGVSLAGAAAMLAQACSNSTFNGTANEKQKHPDAASPSNDSSATNPVTECQANQTKNLCTADDNCQWQDSQCSAIGTECATIPAQDACNNDPSCQWQNNACAAKPGTPATVGNTGGSDGTGGAISSGSDQASCSATNATQLSTAALTDATGGYVPNVKFYGRDTSGMIAMQFGAAAADINQVVVTKKDGTLLALHGITGADKKSDGSWRPIVIDNIALADDSVILVIQAKSGTFKHTTPKTYFKSFNGKTVVDLSGQTVPAAMIGHQSVTCFSEGAGTNDVSTFKQDATEQYPGKYNGGTPRFLNTAQSTSRWTPETAFIKGTVTDIMGQTIDLTGGGILEYQLFCTYVDVDGSHVARTMLQIG